MQDKQKSIGHEWAVIGIAGSFWPLRVPLAVVQNLPKFSAKMAWPPTKSWQEKPLHDAMIFVWMLCKTNKSPLDMNGL